MSLGDKLKTAAGITLAGLGLTALVEIAGCATGSGYSTSQITTPQTTNFYDGPRFFACKEMIDQNNRPDFPEDFPGVNSVFRANEPFRIVSYWENKKGGTAKARLINLSDKEELPLGGDNYISGNYFIMTAPIILYKPGLYRVEYFYNGSYEGGNEIQIIEPIISN